MSHKQNDLFYEARGEWLDGMGRREGDVMEDKDGEFVKVDGEDDFEKVYLPDDIQSSHE